MRAEFDNFVILRWGLTTATPGVIRVAAMECRFVPDSFFVDTTTPLSPSVAYFNCTGAIPLASTNTNLGAGVWSFDFGKADIAEFNSMPGVFFLVVRVESCTWPDPGAPYYRASLVQIEYTPPMCSDSYLGCYRYTGTGDPIIGEVTQVDTLNWSDGEITLQAETDGPPGVGCISHWVFKANGVTYEGDWNGIGTTTLTANDGSGWTIYLEACP